MGRQMPTPRLCTSGKDPSLTLLEDEMRMYIAYMATLHKRITIYVSDWQKQEVVQEKFADQKRSIVQPGDEVVHKGVQRKMV